MIVFRAPVPPVRTTAPIREWPSEDRPRERMLELGARALSPRELLALLIETGTPGQGERPAKSALDLAGDLLRWSAGAGSEISLRRILTAPLPELCEVPGIGPAKAARVQAALELGRRAAAEMRAERDRITAPRDVYERMKLALRDLAQEEFYVVLLNTQCEVMREARVSTGTVDASLVHARDVFRPALVEAAASLVLVHNHPSGEPTPSDEDRALTAQMVRAGEMLGVQVLDHVIVGEGRYVSFVEAGLMPADRYLRSGTR
jgi:DNA repair protein RadC